MTQDTATIMLGGITVVLALLILIFAGILTVLISRLKLQQDQIARTGDKVHGLVNSASLLQLKVNADLARWKADHPAEGLPIPDHIKEAEKAEDLYRKHLVKQQKVDADMEGNDG